MSEKFLFIEAKSIAEITIFFLFNELVNVNYIKIVIKPKYLTNFNV